ncbi:tolB protein precursor, periplasmic protein involved in the tonb-independent uptake of group A colicins [hydrothermal vent metagenome]|uniref:TolB protein, periplasmic protein involved in the tonb-independent uptake of group A colicins n=1 Tax=hydrothermal vent metagenome TaxID=652676 RepID=A0A3B0ZYE6_9ZZZZ
MFKLKGSNLKSILIVATAVQLVACGGGGGAGDSSLLSRNAETLVFVASDGATVTGENELYAVEDNASGQRLLSKNAVASDSDIFSFALSPDKQWVAYIADHDGSGKYALYVVAISGGTPQQVSRVSSERYRTVKSFQWSPDSRQLVFAANLDAPLDGNFSHLANEIYVVNRDSTAQTKVNGDIGIRARVNIRNPQWSADGRYIVQEVTTFRSGSSSVNAFALNIYDSNIATANSRRLVTASTNRSIRNVRWSPNSKRLAFTADYDSQGVFQVYAIGISGLPFKQVTNNGDFNSDSKWSADGSELAYLDHPTSPFPADLVVSPGDGSASDRTLAFVSSNNRFVKDFQWSPDSSKIAYTSDEDQSGLYELYVVAASGTGLRTKINGAMVANGDVVDFQWSPNGRKIAYAADQESDSVRELFISNINGTENTKLSSGLSNTELKIFVWSGDGARIAFSEGASRSRSRANQLYVNNVAGSALLQVNDVLTDNIKLFSY